MYFSKTVKARFIELLIYVDMLISSKDMNDLQRLKKLLKIEFEMKDLGITKKIIRMDIKRDRAKGILTLS